MQAPNFKTSTQLQNNHPAATQAPDHKPITHATNKATAAGGNTKKSSPMLVVAKRAFVACGTVRVRASVNTDTAAVDAGSEVIIQLDANWIAFHAMAVKCIQQHERK